MSCTLYIAENCHECGEVVEYLEKNQIQITQVNVDQSNEKPPVQLFAFPALFENGELQCYGSDIKRYFKKKSHTIK